VIDTVVIPAAGLGGRLIPATKEIPKIMLPIFQKNKKGKILMKPLIEIMFENLYDSGIRNFCFIVGRGKETLENHITPHYEFVDFLNKQGFYEYSAILSKLYQKIEKSSIVWKRQPIQRGIGNTVLLAKDIVGDKPFLFHLGDLYIPKTDFLKKMYAIHEKLKPSATIALKTVDNPKQYGIAYGSKLTKDTYKITKVIEKPKKSNSKLGLAGVNVFEPDIYYVAKVTKQNKKGEIELTDCVQTLIKLNHPILGYKMKPNELCIDMGTPTNYFNALTHSFKKNVSS